MLEVQGTSQKILVMWFVCVRRNDILYQFPGKPHDDGTVIVIFAFSVFVPYQFAQSHLSLPKQPCLYLFHP
jgi:hypothetical protein